MPLVGAVLVVVLISAVLVVRVAGGVLDRTEARAAADAAALAGVHDGRAGAERLAVANGATLVGYVTDGRTVEVRVRVGGSEASARATSTAEVDVAKGR